MKTCAKCKQEKQETEFNRKNSKRLQAYCKPCLYRYQMDRWIARKRKAIEYKGGGCNLCGYKKNLGALQFHHRDPSIKLVTWNKMRLINWKATQTELDKCDLLCANCHAEHHYPDGVI